MLVVAAVIALVVLADLAPYPMPHFVWRGRFRAWHAVRLGPLAIYLGPHPWRHFNCGHPGPPGWHATRITWRLYRVARPAVAPSPPAPTVVVVINRPGGPPCPRDSISSSRARRRRRRAS